MKFTQAILKKNWLVQKIPCTALREIKEEFVRYINYETKLSYVIVPKGFKTNFWSIPKIVQNIFCPTKYLWYVLHDMLYSLDAKIIISSIDKFDQEIKKLKISFNKKDKNELTVYPSRKIADEILREAIKIEWGGFIERNLIYVAVRIWWCFWFFHTK